MAITKFKFSIGMDLFLAEVNETSLHELARTIHAAEMLSEISPKESENKSVCWHQLRDELKQ